MLKFPLSKKASATATDVNGSIKEATKPQLPNFLCPPPSSPPWPRSALPLSGDEDRDRIGGTENLPAVGDRRGHKYGGDTCQAGGRFTRSDIGDATV